ncbi:hypothetical protein BH10BAC2_BH10BAC2_08970 [soil metagenome]
MKTVYLFIIIMLLTSLQLSAQTWQWTKPEPNGILETPVGNNSNGAEPDKVHDIETDAAGNVYVLGDFHDSLYLNNIVRPTAHGSSGSYLAKYDSTGNLLWYRLVRNTNASPYDDAIKATDLAVTSQGVFITGKYMPIRLICSNYDCSTGTNTCSTILSYSLGNFTFNSAFNEIGFFVTKFNANGGVVWNKLGTSQSCFDGAYLGAGFMEMGDVDYPLITSDENNNIICEFTFMGNDGHFVSLGSDNIPLPASISAGAMIVFKMNNAGVMQWSNYAYKASNAGTSHECHSLITDANGNIFLYGVASDSCSFGPLYYRAHFRENEEGIIPYSTFIAKISATGSWQFAKELCNSSRNFLSNRGGNADFLATDGNNNLFALVTLNSIYGVITGDTVPKDKANTYLVKLDNNGNTIFRNFFGGIDTYASSINYANSALYISGGIRTYTPWYFSNLSVQPSTGNAVFEYYNARVNLDGEFQWVNSFSGNFHNEGFAVRAFGNNVYTGGYYSNNITTLGNLNGTFTTSNNNANIFFGKLKDEYIRVGAVTPTQFIPGCAITVPFTSYGLTFSAGNTFTAQLSDAVGDFTTHRNIGSTISTGTGSISATIPANVLYGAGYRVRIRSSDTLATGYNYYAYADTPYIIKLLCPPPISGFFATNITGSTATVNWTAVGCASGYRIQYRIKGTTSWTTAGTLTTNTPTFNLTGLTVNTIYQWRVATRCRNNGTISFSAYTTAKQFKTAVAFAVTSTDAIKAVQNTQLLVQPNPATNSAILSVKGNVRNATVSIVDFVGKTVWEKNGVNAGQLMLPLQNLSTGIYLVKLVNGNETKIVRLVKQ